METFLCFATNSCYGHKATKKVKNNNAFYLSIPWILQFSRLDIKVLEVSYNKEGKSC